VLQALLGTGLGLLSLELAGAQEIDLRNAHPRPQQRDPLVSTRGARQGTALTPVDSVQYIAVQASWGVDAQRMQGRLDTFYGTTTWVPQSGVLWVFAVRE
jgi:hypothetical protein